MKWYKHISVKIVLFVTLPVWIVPALFCLFIYLLWDSFSELLDEMP